MAENPIDSVRLSLMQDVLPVGIAMVERVRKGGTNKLAEAFASSDEPFQALRLEGEPAAKTLRERLDQFSPGLGNPVVSVKVDVDSTTNEIDEPLNQEPLNQEPLNQEPLNECLNRIQSGVEELESLLVDDGSFQSISSPD